MADSDLKRFLDAKKADTRLTGEVERHLLRRPQGNRSTTVLHPSEIIKSDFCHRYSYYLMTGGKNLEKTPGLRLQSIFDEGHAIHHKWQNWFREMDVLFGEWKCLMCKEITEGISVAQCEHCGCKLLEYNEVTLRDEELRIEGHTDGWIIDDKGQCLIEIKSIGAGTLRFEAPDLLADAGGDVTKAWKNIRRPFRSHLLQGQLYLELAQRMFGGDAPTEIVFLYELKADQDYKEFTVKADNTLLEKVLYGAKVVNDAIDAGVMPECNVDWGGKCKACKDV